jgi:hypothetical protein
MSSIDDLFGDLSGAGDVFVDGVKQYAPTAGAAVASVVGWHFLEEKVIANLRNKLFAAAGGNVGSKASVAFGDLVEAAAGIGLATVITQRRLLGQHSAQVAAGVAIGLVFDAAWDLAKTFLPENMAAAFAGLSGSKIYLAGTDPYHLLAAAPMLVEQMSGAPLSVESMGGAPLSISGFSGAPVTSEEVSGVGATLTAAM